jgi:Raf kinase inhibitor-like YbhB/YbcL family protein
MRHDDWLNVARVAIAVGAVMTATLLGEPRADQQQQQPPPANPTGQPPAGQRGGGQRGRGGVQVMTLSTTAWADGGIVPAKYSQAGRDVSPPLTWGAPPETASSFVLLVHDLDAINNTGVTSPLHWLVWNIPGALRGLPEGVPGQSELPDGTRQISQSGPYYRGPAAPATGPVHHYAFELYAIEGTIDVPAVGASPAETRAAVFAAMSGRIRAKATLVGVYKREAVKSTP